MHTRREWRSGERNTYREKVKEISLQKDKSFFSEYKEIWGNETALHGTVYEIRKRERSNEDGLFMSHQKGPITSTFTVDWFLREGQGRDLLGDWINEVDIEGQPSSSHMSQTGSRHLSENPSSPVNTLRLGLLDVVNEPQLSSSH